MSPSTTISDIASLSAEVGLISFQGELKMPFGKNRRWCWQHARRTWIIAFQLVENSLKYSFSDYNMRYIFHSNNHKNIYLYLLHGNDNLKTEGSVGLSLRWGNDMAALHFDFRRYKKNNWILYFPSYHNNVDFSFNDATANLRFDISTFWNKNKTQIKHFLFELKLWFQPFAENSSIRL